jgi:membrane protein YqaA with SNARE-associated domain
LTEDLTLSALFLSSFLAATLLPGGSEAVLFGVLKGNAQLFWPALGVATLGNTLGGMTSYWLGRVLPVKKQPGRALAWTHRYGSPALLLAWAPLIGDALCVAAGWLRLNAWYVLLFMAAGKFARYLVIAWLTA